MNIESLNLFASIAMVLTCVIGIVCNPPTFRRLNLAPFRAAAASIHNAAAVSSAHNVASYPMRHCTTDANGNSNYYRFTITRAGRSYRAYLDSAPRFNRSWEELGLKQDNNRYYIDAGRNSTAEACENAARNWANSHVNDLTRIG